ncbi:MAG: hypothetical protein GX565_05595, partial [Lentisphaerae bacterium]|nr:hypothetical protein [Lentisphaerota bacterium]
MSVQAATNYVDAVNGADANDGLTAGTPKRTLQAAVDAASEGDIVLAAPGLYAEGGRPEGSAGEGYDSLTNRVIIDKALTLRAAAGPAQTFIVGAPGAGVHGLGPDAVRCVRATFAGTLIAGFTLTNGHTAANEWNVDSMGGGAYLGNENIVLSNCVVAGNAANNGGGTCYGQLNECRIIGNRAASEGGGAMSSTRHDNCVFINNTARFGGGASSCNLYHCTLVGNTASEQGGGAAWCSLYNSIAYYNDAPQTPNTLWGSIGYSCVTPAPQDAMAVITTDPRFADTNGWADLRLTLHSLCINGGSADYSASATDLDGQPRISGVLPDMGAYEWQGDVLPIVSFSDAASEQIESDGALQLAVTLSQPPDATTAFALVFGGSATRGIDYTAIPDTLVFEPGVTETNVYVTLIEDADPEYPETITVSLAPTNTYRANVASHTLTLIDNDGMPEITQLQINQGAGGTANREVQLTVLSINEPTEYAVGEDASFSNATWNTLPEGTITYTLSEGFGAKTVWIKLRKPYGEGYIVSLSASVVIYLGPTLDIAIDQPGADIDTGIMMSGFGTIGLRVPLSRTPSDTEESPGWFGILDEEALNGSLARSAVPLAGSSSIDSWLSLLATPTVPSRLTFTYENVGNANLNFYTNNSYVSFDAWEPGPHTFMCDIEPGAHVLRWEASGYGYGGQIPGYSTLDAVSLEALPPRVWFLTPTQTVAESAGAVPVDLALEWPCGTPVNVSYLQSGNATAGADYSVSPAGTVTFAPGQTRTNFTVTVINDSAAEPGEFVLFTLSDGDGYRQGVPNQHALTILANDGIIELLQVILENGAAQTTNQTVQLLAVCSESPTDLLLSESPDFTDASWQSYADPVAFALSDGYGVKTVYVKARLALDGGGWSETGVGSATIERVACTLQDALDTDIAVTSGPDAAWFG